MLAHVYRGEVYRSTTWRTRLDATTNWAVVTLGIGVSVTFSSADASPLPLILTGLIGLFLLMLEGRRYRYFNVWRARARWMETHLIAPMLEDGDLHCEENWQAVLARDYHRPRYHISYVRAVGRRLRSNFIWIFMIVAVAYVAKIAVHPLPVTHWTDLPARAAIGPFPGWAVLALYIDRLCRDDLMVRPDQTPRRNERLFDGIAPEDERECAAKTFGDLEPTLKNRLVSEDYLSDHCCGVLRPQ